MSSLIGTRTAHVAGNANLATRTLFATGTSGLILGIYFACDGALDEVVHTNGAGTILTTQTALADTTASMEVPFLVDGFIIGAAEATSFITVIYRPGA